MKKEKNSKYLLISIASVVAFVLIWYLLVDVFKLTNQVVFPGPIKVVKTFITKLTTKAPDGATLGAHTLSSLKVALLGYAIGAVIGNVLGIITAWNKWADRFIRPIIDLLRPIPGIALIPLFILLFGIGIGSKAAVIAFASMMVTIVNSYSGIKQTTDEHLWVGDVFGASSMQKLFRIAIPTAAPLIFTGLRVALGASWTTLVAAELLAASKGLGYLIQQARAITRTDLIIVGMLVIGVIGLLFDVILRVVEKQILKGLNVK